MIDVCKLEFSHKQQCFHFNELGKDTPKKNDWKLLGETSLQLAMSFIAHIEKKYVTGRKTGTIPYFDIIKTEWELYNKLISVRHKYVGR